MIRSIVAVVATYIVMCILIIGVFMGMWFGMGPNRLLEPGSFKGNMFLCIAAPSITVLAGLFGGWMCAKIGRSSKPVMALAGVVLALGLLSAYLTLQKPFPADPRDPNMTMEEFMKVGREPTWLAIFNPIGGAAAVLLGGMCMAGCAARKPQ
ncbi:MAG: hypothetical protein ACKVS8_08230 [Phycisphaerales bacterium]